MDFKTKVLSTISPLRSKETHLEIQNLCSVDIKNILVSINNADDWENGVGPKDFEGTRIAAGGKVNKREEVAYYAKSNYFTMTLQFADKTNDVFEANLRGAIGEGGVDFKQLAADHEITSTTSGKTLIILVKKK